MTLTCVTKAPELWKCAVDIFGPSNLFTFSEIGTRTLEARELPSWSDDPVT